MAALRGGGLRARPRYPGVEDEFRRATFLRETEEEEQEQEEEEEEEEEDEIFRC